MNNYKEFKDEEDHKQEVNKKKEGKQKKPVKTSEEIPHKKASNNNNPSYNPDKIPPDWSLAEDHLSARQTGIKDENNDNICDCCSYPVKKKPFALSCDTLDLKVLGTGYPLFFDFIKYSIAMLFIIFLQSGAYGLISNSLGSDCLPGKQVDKLIGNLNAKQKEEYLKKHRVCSLSSITKLSLANKRHNVMLSEPQGYMNILTIFVIILILQAMRYYQRKVTLECDAAAVTASDYTVVVKGIPNNVSGDFDYDDELKLLFKSKSVPNRDTPIAIVNLCFDLDHLEKLELDKKKSIVKKQKALKQFFKTGNYPKGVTLKSLDQEIDEKEEALEALEKEFLEGKTKQFCGTAFISFSKEEDREECLKINQVGDYQRYQMLRGRRVKHKESQLYLENKLLIVEPPAEPSDVFWENQKFSTKIKLKRRIISMIIIILLLLASSYCIFVLNKLQKSITLNASASGGSKARLQVKIVGGLISVVILIINMILATVIKQSASHDKYSTRTRMAISIAQKISIATFINTGLMPFLITYFYLHNYFESGGLIQNQTLVFLTNAFIPVIKDYVYPPYLIAVLKRRLARRGDPKKCVLTQAEAQTLYENPEYNISQYYADMMKTMFFTAFYAPIIPLGLVISGISLFCLYWTYKYNILRKSSIKIHVGDELSKEMIEYLEFVVIIYSGANFLYHKIFFHTYSYISAAGLIIGILNAVLPMQEVNERFFPINIDDEAVEKYEDIEKDFLTDYERENPATKEDATERFLLKYEKK